MKTSSVLSADKANMYVHGLPFLSRLAVIVRYSGVVIIKRWVRGYRSELLQARKSNGNLRR